MFQVDRRLGNSFPAVIHFIFLFYFGWGPFSWMSMDGHHRLIWLGPARHQVRRTMAADYVSGGPTTSAPIEKRRPALCEGGRHTSRRPPPTGVPIDRLHFPFTSFFSRGSSFFYTRLYTPSLLDAEGAFFCARVRPPSASLAPAARPLSPVRATFGPAPLPFPPSPLAPQPPALHQVGKTFLLSPAPSSCIEISLRSVTSLNWLIFTFTVRLG